MIRRSAVEGWLLQCILWSGGARHPTPLFLPPAAEHHLKSFGGRGGEEKGGGEGEARQEPLSKRDRVGFKLATSGGPSTHQAAGRTKGAF